MSENDIKRMQETIDEAIRKARKKLSERADKEKAAQQCVPEPPSPPVPAPKPAP